MSEPRDAHATARARDARPWRGSTFAEAATDIVQGLASLRTRTHAINPTTGEFTRLDQESDTMTDHRADAERALSSIDASDDPRNLPAGLDGIGNALLAIHDTFAAIHDTLTEIRDRLPEPKREEAFVERRPAAVGHNLRHWKPGVHTAGVDCSCGPEKVPHERAPREDEDPDEALAKALWEIDDPEPNYGWDCARANGVYLRMARAARKYIEAEWKPYILREQAAREKAQDRAAKAEAEVARVTTDLEASRASNDEWIERARRKAAERDAMTDDRDSWEQKASEAEAALADERDRHDATITERDALRERLDDFRADVETRWAFVDDNFIKDIFHGILKGDRQRGSR